MQENRDDEEEDDEDEEDEEASAGAVQIDGAIGSKKGAVQVDEAPDLLKCDCTGGG